MKYIKIFFINVFVTFILTESLCFIFIYFFNYTKAPSYVLPSTPFCLDNNQFFGVWHKSNSTYNHQGECYNAIYKFNSYGARDKEREIESISYRGIILGDSFIEGYGIKDHYRISNILEDKLGIDILNFGTSGHFGTTQIALNYQYLSSKFDHDFIIIGIYPTNDFDENNLEYGKSFLSNRYRPYRVKSEGNEGYDLIYFLDDIKDSDWSSDNFYKNRTSFLTIFRKMTYTGSVLYELRNRYLLMIQNLNSKEKKLYSRFNDFSKEEIAIIKFDLQKIKKISNGKSIFLFAIPSIYDFNYALRGGSNFNKLGIELLEFCKDNDIEYIDLFSELLKEYNENNFRDLYLSCDHHFSEIGNQVCSDIIHKYFKLTLLN